MTTLVFAPPPPLPSAASRPVRIDLRGTPPPEARGILSREITRHPGLAVVAEESTVDTAGESAPDLLLQFVRHPDEFDLGRIADWMRSSPGTRLLVVGNAWCLGTARNRHFEPAGLWVGEEHFRSRLALEFEVWSGGRPPLPPTADRSEVFAAEMAAPRALLSRRISVTSPDSAFRAFCAEELTRQGADVEIAPGRAAGADAIVLDADPSLEAAMPEDWKPSCPILLLSTTPWAIAPREPRERIRVTSKFSGGTVWSKELGELLSSPA